MKPEYWREVLVLSLQNSDFDAPFDDLTLYVGPYPPVVGRDAIRTTMETYFARGTCVELKILYLSVDGKSAS